MAKAKYSLSSIKIGAIANDGGMGTVLEEIGINKVVQNTVVLNQEEGSKTSFPLEIEDQPIFTVTTPGETTLAVDLYLTDGQQLERLFGGTYTPAASGNPESYEFPREQVQMEKSVVLVHKNGAKLEIPRLQLVARFEWNFRRDALALIHLTGTVLIPDKAGIGPYKYTDAPAQP